MEETLQIIGVKTQQLQSKPIHTRTETEEILGCTNQTLNSFKRKGWIKPSRFKNKNFYTSTSILECIKYQLGEYSDIQISNKNEEWENYVNSMWS